MKKNKPFLQGVNLVQSQIIFNDSNHEEKKLNRRTPQQYLINSKYENRYRKQYSYLEKSQEDYYNSNRYQHENIYKDLNLRSKNYIKDKPQINYPDFKRNTESKHRVSFEYSDSIKVREENLLKQNSTLEEQKDLYKNLSKKQLEFLNDYFRNGYNNIFNIFEQEETIKEVLPKCFVCSTNLEPIIKTYICTQQKCQQKYEFLCSICCKYQQNLHFGHRILPIFSILYYYQKKQNANTNNKEGLKNKLVNLIEQVNSNLQILKEQQKKLIEIKEISTEFLKRIGDIIQQQQSFNMNFANILKSITENTVDEIQNKFKQIIKKINIESLFSTVEFPKLRNFFPKTQEIIQNLPQKFFPYKQYLDKPALLEPFSLITNSFLSEEIQIQTSYPLNIKQLGKLKLICDGEMKTNIEKVKQVKVLFKGRRMDRQIRNIVQMLKKWSQRKNKFKCLDLSFDYKVNSHPTTENSTLFSDLLKINVSSLKLSLLNVKGNEIIRQEFNQIFTNFRQMKSLNLSITMNHLHSSVPIYLENNHNFIQFIESLGNKILHLNLKLPLTLPEKNQLQLITVLKQKKQLLELNLKFEQSFTYEVQIIYAKIRNQCQKRKNRVYSIYNIKYKSKLTNKLGTLHKDFIDFIN